MYPLNSIENSTEASTWAFSSHEVAGHRGTFTPKPIKKQRPVSTPHRDGVAPPVYGPPIRPSPVRSPALPTRVQINISRAASLARSDLEVNKSMYRALKSKNSKETNISHKLLVDMKTRPADRLIKPDIRVGPTTVIGLDWDSIKKGRLPTSSAHRTPTSTASQLENDTSTAPPITVTGWSKPVDIRKLINVVTVASPANTGIEPGVEETLRAV